MANLSTATKAKNKKLSALRQSAKMRAGAADLQKKVKAAVDASKQEKDYNPRAPQTFKDYNPRASQTFKDYNPEKAESMPLPKSKPKKPAKKTAKKKESSGVTFDTTGTQPGKTIKGRKYGGAIMKARGGTFKGTF
jgi:type II secretory pathway pseudopilin PulG